MRRALILCLFLILHQPAGNCATSLFPPLQRIGDANVNNAQSNITSLADPFVAQNNERIPDIIKIENSLFGHTFANQNLSARLSRIEKSIFNATYPNSSSSQRIDNIISNFNQINKYPNISKNDLSKIEAKVFNQTFTQNSAERRIDRLEQRMLGAEQSGDLETRYETLKAASKSYNQNNNNADYYPQTANKGIWNGITQALGGGMMGGTMTGFTPQINPFNNYSSGYNSGYNNYNNNLGGNYNPTPYANSSANAYPSGGGIYRGYRSNHGYSDSYQNYGSGAGVTILD